MVSQTFPVLLCPGILLLLMVNQADKRDPIQAVI